PPNAESGVAGSALSGEHMNRIALALGVGVVGVALIAGCSDDGDNGGTDLGTDGTTTATSTLPGGSDATSTATTGTGSSTATSTSTSAATSTSTSTATSGAGETVDASISDGATDD